MKVSYYPGLEENDERYEKLEEFSSLENGFVLSCDEMKIGWNIVNKNSFTRHILRSKYFLILLPFLYAITGKQFFEFTFTFSCIFNNFILINIFALIFDKIQKDIIKKAFFACVEMQEEKLKSYQPDLIIGSSWGGAVALALVLKGSYKKDLILISPILSVIENLSPGIMRELLINRTVAVSASNNDSTKNIKCHMFISDDDDIVDDSEMIRLFTEIKRYVNPKNNDWTYTLEDFGGHRMPDLLDSPKFKNILDGFLCSKNK